MKACPPQLARPACLWSFLAFLCLCLGASAQPLSNLVFTVGTTIQDAALKNWSYVLLGSPQPPLLAGKKFAIYGKTGFPTNAGAFTLRATIAQQTDAAAVNTSLSLSNALGDDLSSLSSSLTTLLHKIPGAASQPLPQQILTAFQISAADLSIASALTMLERLHPCLTLCAGQAFAETITNTITYEVREVDPNTGAANAVIGRVTIMPGAPVVLPAPGMPFQVVTNAPSDHLRIRLRWGTPDALRRLGLLQFGFNVWRIPSAAALAGNFNVTPPTPAQLHSNPGFTRVNLLPAQATMDYAPLFGAGGPDDATDRVTYFFSDRNGRSPGIAQFPSGSTPPGYLTPPFNDGDTFYYFITARDVLGRDGLVSPGGQAMACRKLPPQAPAKLSVLNTTQVLPLGGGAATNQQRLQIQWAQNTNSSDAVSNYWVYRWPNPAMALTNDSTPSNNLIGVASQLPNASFNSLIDNASNPPSGPGPSNYWYTVRAVSPTACGLLFSPNSPPASGVLRQRAAPPAATGELLGSCGAPAVLFQGFNALLNPNGPDTNNWNYRVTVARRDAGIAWAQIVVGSPYSATAQTFGPLYFPPEGNSLSIDVPLAAPGPGVSTNFQATCVVGTYYGLTSPAASCYSTNPVPSSQISEALFNCGELLLTALSSSDPFLQALNLNQSVCYPAIAPTRDASGTLHMRFDAGTGLPMMIQYGTNVGTATYWTDIGVATPDSSSVYSVYLCPCVIGPLPQLRGCTLNLPTDGFCDQHVSRAGDSGAIAPILVKFRLTPRTHEYRLYRSVDGGAPTLIAQEAALYDPANPGIEIVRTDDAMPPSAARLCYFVQTLDENGNGSPLALIGCKSCVPPKPPRPLLSEPAPIGDTSNPQVALNWFCPTEGVYRFEIRIQRADQPGSGRPTGLIGSNLFILASARLSAAFYGLHLDSKLLARYDEWQLTPPIGGGFGPGPQFSLSASVVPNVPYHISVAAEGVAGNWGDASSEWTFIWKPPPTIQTVPWPARPLPPLRNFDDSALNLVSLNPLIPRVKALLLQNANLQLDAHYPVGIRVGDLSPALNVAFTIGTTNPVVYVINPYAGSFKYGNPNYLIFTRNAPGDPSRNGQSLFPIVVYRQQVTNQNFPRVSGNLAQVTPLMDQIPYYTRGTSDAMVVTISDLLMAAGTEAYTVLDHTYSGAFLYVRDQQPVILGASYQYFVVRFETNREVSEVIPAGTVTIPTSP